jgi:hypothetical protein
VDRDREKLRATDPVFVAPLMPPLISGSVRPSTPTPTICG